MATLPRLTRRGTTRQYGNPNALTAAALAEAGISSADMRALTAAGVRIDRDDAATLRNLIQPWQSRAFSYYDKLGEIKFASQFYSRMLSPLRLYAAELDENGDWVETENEVAKAALARVQDPGGGTEDLLGSYGRLMFLVGEAYLLCTNDEETGLEQWEMLSTDELRIQGETYSRYRAPSLMVEQLTEPSEDDWEPVGDTGAIAYRLWRRHPRYSALADSTMMGVLDLCEELLLLTRAVRARARSRLAGSGILAISEDFSYAPMEAVPDEDPNSDPFLSDLTAAMMLPIANEGTASAVVPLLIRGDTDAVKDGIKHIQIVDPTQLYPETGLRTECIDRIAVGLDMPPEILKGLGDNANHWCVDDQTEILTADGWKHHDELDVDDTVLTLNHETGLSEWERVEQVARFEVADLPMRSIETRFHSSLTTMNHRWPVLQRVGRDHRWERAWTHSDELRTTQRLITAAPSQQSLWPQYVQHDDAAVELIAWLWTEGSIREREGRLTPQVAIYQSHAANPENVLSIRAALTALHGAPVMAGMDGGRRGETRPPAWREVQEGSRTRFVLNQAAAEPLLHYIDSDRVVSTDFIRTLTASQLALFIDVSVRADGALMRSGCALVGQKDPARLFPFELAVILSGRSPSSYTQTHDGFKRHEQHYVSSSRRQTVTFKKRQLRERRYTGIVWCPVTGNTTWMARRNGKVYFTGNTAWQITDDTWQAHGMPIANQLVNDLTASYFRPQLREDGVPDAMQYAIRYDAAAVINHPDRTTDAKEAYDRRAIGKPAYRRILNFNEDDAPTEDELAEMIGVATRDSSLAWDKIPAPRGGNLETSPGVLAAPDANTEIQPGTGADVEKAAPTVGDTPVTAVEASANGNGHADAETLGRILGGADLAVLRAREAAGNKLLTLARRHPDVMEILDADVRARDVAPALGPDRVRALGVTEAELVKAGSALIADALRLWIKDRAKVKLIAEQIERHAARTLYEAKPVPYPAQFRSYVSGVIAGK